MILLLAMSCTGSNKTSSNMTQNETGKTVTASVDSSSTAKRPDTNQNKAGERDSEKQKADNNLQTALNTKLVDTQYKDLQELRKRLEELGLYNIGGSGLTNDNGVFTGLSIEVSTTVKGNDQTKYCRFLLVKNLENGAVKVVDELAFDRNASGYIGFVSIIDDNANTGIPIDIFARYVQKGEKEADIKCFYEVENDKFVSKKPSGKWHLYTPD